VPSGGDQEFSGNLHWTWRPPQPTSAEPAPDFASANSIGQIDIHRCNSGLRSTFASVYRARHGFKQFARKPKELGRMAAVLRPKVVGADLIFCPSGNKRQFGAAADVELLEDTVEMHLNGSDAHAELFRYFLVPEPTRH
jgi:hypothetical protein